MVLFLQELNFRLQFQVQRILQPPTLLLHMLQLPVLWQLQLFLHYSFSVHSFSVPLAFSHFLAALDISLYSYPSPILSYLLVHPLQIEVALPDCFYLYHVLNHLHFETTVSVSLSMLSYVFVIVLPFLSNFCVMLPSRS